MLARLGAGVRRWFHQIRYVFVPWKLVDHRGVDCWDGHGGRVIGCDCGRLFYCRPDTAALRHHFADTLRFFHARQDPGC